MRDWVLVREVEAALPDAVAATADHVLPRNEDGEYEARDERLWGRFALRRTWLVHGRTRIDLDGGERIVVDRGVDGASPDYGPLDPGERVTLERGESVAPDGGDVLALERGRSVTITADGGGETATTNAEDAGVRVTVDGETSVSVRSDRRDTARMDTTTTTRVVQRTFLAGESYLLVFAAFAWAAALALFVELPPPLSLVSLWSLLPLAGVAWTIHYVHDELPFPQYTVEHQRRDAAPYVVTVVGCFLLLLAGAFLPPTVSAFLIPAYLALGVAILWSDPAYDAVQGWCGAVTNAVTRAPTLSTHYVVTAGVGVVVGSGWYLYVGQDVVGATLVLFPLVTRGLFLVLLAGGVYWLYNFWRTTVDHYADSVDAYRIVGTDGVEGRERLLTACVVAATGLLSGGVLVAMLLDRWPRIVAYTAVAPEFGLLTLLFLLPPLYFLVGGAFQVGSTVLARYRLRRDTRPVTLDLPFDPAVPIRVHETKPGYVGAVSFGRRSAVVVGEGVIEAFGDPDREVDPLAALVAHEEGHVDRGDDRRALVTSLLSPLCLTGRNVFFALQNVREWEYRADRYAVERVGGRTALIDALDRLDDLETERHTSVGFAASPLAVADAVDVDAGGALERAFGIFHGTYGLTKAHPSPADRIERLEPMDGRLERPIGHLEPTDGPADDDAVAADADR